MRYISFYNFRKVRHSPGPALLLFILVFKGFNKTGRKGSLDHDRKKNGNHFYFCPFCKISFKKHVVIFRDYINTPKSHFFGGFKTQSVGGKINKPHHLRKQRKGKNTANSI